MRDITEKFQIPLTGRPKGSTGTVTVNAHDFDIAIGNLPFLLDAQEELPYERATAQWQKDQFDADRNVGEQSLTGWWLRSQSSFRGGTGVTYFEPLLGEGSELRFRDSRGVDVFSESGEVSLLRSMQLRVPVTGAASEAVAGSTRVLIRDGGTCRVWSSGAAQVVTGTSNASGIAYTGSKFLVAHSAAISEMDAEGAGTSLTQLWTNPPGSARIWWAKQRIFAAIGPDVYELSLAGGSDWGDPLYTHPDPGWTWTSVAETGGAVWASGFSGAKSAVHVFTVEPSGEIPALSAAAVGIQLPDGERANALLGYLDFLLVATSRGVRVCVTDGDRAGVGPLLWDGEEAFSLAARGDYAWVGLGTGLTRRIDLGTPVVGDLGFAYANDLETTSGQAPIRSMTWFNDDLHVVQDLSGLWSPGANRVATGYLTTGFMRFGTLERKFFEGLSLTANSENGNIAIGAGANDPLPSLLNLGNFNGTEEVTLNLPNGGIATRVSVRFTLSRSAADPTTGPILQSYQVRALPAPAKKQRLYRVPLRLKDWEVDRRGNHIGGEGFAWSRLQELEQLEESGRPAPMRDYRTGESRMVIVEQIHFSTMRSPSFNFDNFEGTISVTLRTVD